MKHGAQYAYKIKGCRCQECRNWNTTENKRYRQNRKAKGIERMLQGRWVMARPDSQSAS